MKTYVIADTHLNHDKIKTYCDRPEFSLKDVPQDSMVGTVMKAIHDGVGKQIEEAKERAIKEFTKEFEEEVRKAVANISLRLFDTFTVERPFGNELIIRVQIEGSKNG